MALFPDFERTYSCDQVAPTANTTWIVVRGGAIVIAADSTARLPRGENPPAGDGAMWPAIALGRFAGSDYRLLETAVDAPPAEGWESVELRGLYGRLPETEWFIAGYALQVSHWHRTSPYCPVCGSEMGAPESEWRRRCANCTHERYPIVSPAVLALVHDGDRVLLAHKPGWGRRRSILAGFALPGESLEECVHREVLEEAGVCVEAPRYFGSQPWPFPQQLMIGYFAGYLSGEIRIDTEELEGADWYDYRDLPPLPPPLSLSRRMIDAWATRRAEP